jgi:hypothetical protein
MVLETLMGPLEVTAPAPEWIGSEIGPTWSAETKPLGLQGEHTVREVASPGGFDKGCNQRFRGIAA